MDNDDKTRIETLTSYHNFFSRGDGKRVLEDLKRSLDGDTYRGSDTHASAYHAGRRSVYLDIAAAVETGRLLVENDGQVPGQQETYEQSIDDFFKSIGRK